MRVQAVRFTELAHAVRCMHAHVEVKLAGLVVEAAGPAIIRGKFFSASDDLDQRVPPHFVFRQPQPLGEKIEQVVEDRCGRGR